MVACDWWQNKEAGPTSALPKKKHGIQWDATTKKCTKSM